MMRRANQQKRLQVFSKIKKFTVVKKLTFNNLEVL